MLSPGGLVGRSVSSFRGGGLSSLVGGFGGVVENHLYCELVLSAFLVINDLNSHQGNIRSADPKIESILNRSDF